MRVLQQMRQRELNHEMRNLSAKLTPAERRAKRNAKLQEDTSRQVFIAVFRIKDFSDAKHRYLVMWVAVVFWMPLNYILLCLLPPFFLDTSPLFSNLYSFTPLCTVLLYSTLHITILILICISHIS